MLSTVFPMLYLHPVIYGLYTWKFIPLIPLKVIVHITTCELVTFSSLFDLGCGWGWVVVHVTGEGTRSRGKAGLFISARWAQHSCSPALRASVGGRASCWCGLGTAPWGQRAGLREMEVLIRKIVLDRRWYYLGFMRQSVAGNATSNPFLLPCIVSFSLKCWHIF